MILVKGYILYPLLHLSLLYCSDVEKNPPPPKKAWKTKGLVGVSGRVGIHAAPPYSYIPHVGGVTAGFGVRVLGVKGFARLACARPASRGSRRPTPRHTVATNGGGGGLSLFTEHFIGHFIAFFALPRGGGKKSVSQALGRGETQSIIPRREATVKVDERAVGWTKGKRGPRNPLFSNPRGGVGDTTFPRVLFIPVEP